MFILFFISTIIDNILVVLVENLLEIWGLYMRLFGYPFYLRLFCIEKQAPFNQARPLWYLVLLVCSRSKSKNQKSAFAACDFGQYFGMLGAAGENRF